jgi:uncharacterized delta-60 repeat protein
MAHCIAAALALAGGACGGGGGAGPAPDTTPPTVLSTSPPAEATNVPSGTGVSITLSEPIDPTSVTSASITLVASGGAPVPGASSCAGATATFSPAAPLTWGTAYTAVAAGLRDRAGNALAAPHAWTFTTAAEPDTTAPTVAGTFPPDGASLVAPGVVLAVTFSEPMDPTTLTTETFTLATIAGAPVEGTVAAAGDSATFTPLTPLDAATAYRATVWPGAADLSTNGLAAPYEWTFTTAPLPDTIPPTVVGRSPAPDATGVPTTAVVVATFSEAVHPSSVTAATFALVGPDATPVSASVSAAGDAATLTPAAPLAWSTTYTAHLTTGVTDLAGNPLGADVTWSFTTGDQPDTTPPAVVARSPSPDATGVAPTAVVQVGFTELVDPATVGGFTLRTADGALVPGTLSASGATVTFTPSALPYGAVLTARIDGGVTDLAGNPLGADVLWSFSTVPLPAALDPAYGWSGVAAIPAASPVDLAVDGTGRAWVVGSQALGPAVLLRLDSGGALDPTFGNGGRVAWSAHADNPWGHGTSPVAIALSGSGAFVAGYAYQDPVAIDDLFLAAVTAEGTLDPAFGASGLVRFDLGGDEYADDLAVQPDGKVVVLADRCIGGDCDVLLLRYLPTGALDPSFGMAGVATYSSAAWPQPYGTALALLPAGELVVVGSEGDSGLLLRFLPDGSLDPSFGAGGIARFDVPAGEEAPVGIGLAAGGALLSAGTMGNGFDYDLFAIRVLPDGALDPSYGTSGVGSFGMTELELANRFTVGPADVGWIAAESQLAYLWYATFLKVGPQGRLDPTFASAGWLLWRYGEADTSGRAIAVASGGAVYLAASAWTPPYLGPQRSWALVARLR